MWRPAHAIKRPQLRFVIYVTATKGEPGKIPPLRLLEVKAMRKQTAALVIIGTLGFGLAGCNTTQSTLVGAGVGTAAGAAATGDVGGAVAGGAVGAGAGYLLCKKGATC